MDLAGQDSLSHATMTLDDDGYGPVPVYGSGSILPSDGTPKVCFQSTPLYLQRLAVEVCNGQRLMN